MTDKVENSGESPGAAEYDDSNVFVEGNQTEGNQSLDQPVQSASQLPAAIKDESHSTVGPNIVKDKVMAHSMSSDISQNTGIESSIFDFSKWKLERIGENFCLITDTEKIQLPNCFWGKSNPKVLKRENKTLIISPNGHALEVRKGENEKLIFIETKIPLSDTDKNKGLNRLNESTENDTDKLEKHVFAENDGRHSGTAEQNSEMNTKVCHEMQSNKENQGARSDPSHDPARSDSTQLSASRISTTLDAKTHVKEKTFSVVDENVFGNKKSTDGAISTMQEQDRNIEPDKIFKKSTDTGSSDKIKNKGTDQRYNATTDSLCTPLNKTDDSVSKDAEDNYTVSLKNDYQQSVSNPESDRKLPTSESRLEGQITDGTKAKLLIKRDEIETDITELMQKIKIEGNDSKNIASGNGNPLKDGRQQSHEDLWSTRKINEYPVSPFLELIVEYDKQQEDKQQLFSGIEISFKERGKDLVCVVKQEPDTPDSVVDKILKREEFYGKRDITFKDIRHNANVKDMEGMLNALLTDMTKKYEFRWKINTACEKVFIASPSQPIVDKVSSEIKSGLDARCMFLLGTTKKEIYVKQLMAEMNETFGDKVQVGFDPDVWRLNLVGLQKSVAAALKDFSIISKTIHVDSSDKLKFIDTELDKRVDVSHTKLVQIERKENKGKMGFVIHGPSNQVYFLSQKIGEIQNECDISDVDIKDYNSLTYLRSSAGDDFMKRLAAEQNVNINRNWSDEAMSKDIFPTTHTLPTGHQIVLTSLTSTGPKVNFEVSGYSAEPSFMKEEKRIVVHIPRYMDGKEKEKEKFEMVMKQLLKLIQENGLFQVSVCLEEIGGWRFRKLVRIVLYCLKEHMSSYLTIPSTVYLVPMAEYQEAQKAFSDAFPDQEFDDSHCRDDDGSRTEMSVDAWKRGLLEIEADALVYAVHPGLDLKDGNISATLDARAGPQLQAELRRSYKNRKLKPWEFACTYGYELPYKYVFHGALEECKNLDSLKDIRNFIFRCLEKAKELELRVIVFPALGTGRCKYKSKDIATAIYEASMDFEMRFPMSSLKQVIISSTDASAHSEISQQLQTRQESKLLKIGKVLVRTRLVSQDFTAVMADSLVVFWEMKSFSTVRVHDSPFLVLAGSKVSQAFTKGRDMKSGKTFVTEGGNFYTKQIVHLPYHDDENKLESAFEDGIVQADSKHCTSCLLYFTENSPMFKYGDRMMFHILRAIKNLSQRLVNIKSIVILIEGGNLTILNWFEESARKLNILGPRQDESATTQLTTDIDQTITIIGLKENVGRAKQELENKITQLQKSNVIKESAEVAAPGEMDISRTERGLPDDQHHRISSSGDAASRYPSKTDGGEHGVEMKPMKKYEASVTRENMQGVSATKDKQLDVPDSQQWRSSMLVHEQSSTESLCVEIGNINDSETYDSLYKKLYGKKGVPVICPDLKYPFENRNKALLICGSTEDADKLNGFTLESQTFTFRKFTAQCLQMMKVTIPSNYIKILTEREGLMQQLEEIGVIEPEPDDSSVNVTVFTLAQMQVLYKVLKDFEDTPTRTEPVDDDKSKFTGRHVKGTAGGDATHELGRREKSAVRVDASLTRTEDKNSSSEGDINKIEILASGVCEMLWKVFISLNSDELQKLLWDNISLNFEAGSIIMDGYKDERRIHRLKKEIDKLSQLQMEEITPTVKKEKLEYDQWCTDFVAPVGKPCCVYDDENKTFIAFGETYDDIAKVKHQLNIKQGLIKQTGRRRNRNLESSTPSVMNVDTGPRSLPSFSTSLSVPKHGCTDFSWSKDASQLQEYKTKEGIKVFVYVANILRLPVDCIVNAANDTLQHGGGIAAVIERAAGHELTREGNRHTKANGPVPVGKAFTTTAGNLPYDCVIHAVGPRWSDYRPYTYKNVKQCESLLQNAILSSFEEAENRNLKTIALPAISSAIFSVPEEMCAVQYAKAIRNYGSGNASNSDRLQEIHFIDKNPSIIRLIQTTFKTMIEDQKDTDYDVMKYVTQQSPGIGNTSGYSRSVRRPADTGDMGKTLPVFEETSEGCVLYAGNGSKVYVYDGNVLDAHKKHITCIVCADDNTGRGKGGLANALMSYSRGFSYKQDKNDAFNRKWPKEGDIVLSAGNGTGFQNVLHAVLWGTGRMADQNSVVLEAYKNILKESSWRKFSTVAMPVLGTGSYKGITIEESTKAFVTAYLDFCSTSKLGSKLLLYLVCQNPSNRTKVISVIRELLQKEDKTAEPAPKKARDSSIDTGEAKKEAGFEDSDKTCAICMDDISSPKTLPCGHTFCADCINNYLDNYKQACPTCGKVCGIIKGDQPDGDMTVNFRSYEHCAGYEDVGRIDITYSFPGGHQKEGHPEPGKFYAGISRTGYLPDNKEGKEILELLRIAFNRNLVFTIGRSRTTNKEGVITWNDIHHKTSPHPHATFGYPDPGYLERVKDELAAKGVTVDDIPKISVNRGGNRGRRH